MALPRSVAPLLFHPLIRSHNRGVFGYGQYGGIPRDAWEYASQRHGPTETSPVVAASSSCR